MEDEGCGGVGEVVEGEEEEVELFFGGVGGGGGVGGVVDRCRCRCRFRLGFIGRFSTSTMPPHSSRK